MFDVVGVGVGGGCWGGFVEIWSIVANQTKSKPKKTQIEMHLDTSEKFLAIANHFKKILDLLSVFFFFSQSFLFFNFYFSGRRF